MSEIPRARPVGEASPPDRASGDDPLSLVIADGYHLVREGLRLLLEARLDCRVVGEAATGREALSLVEEHRPDILIVDLALPEAGGIDVTRTARARAPDTHVVLLAHDGDEPSVRAALRAGAAAYVLKCAPSDDLLHALVQVSSGQRYLSQPLAERAISSFAQSGQAPAAPTPELSQREREVVGLVAAGMTSAAIAARLGIGLRTVEWHRARVLQKLGLHNVADLVRYALQHGLVAETE